VDIILDGYSGEIPQRTRDIVTKIKNRCELLSRVIKEMLELESLKTQDISELKKINISTIISDIIKKFQVIAGSNNIAISYSQLEDPLYIKGSKKQIQILFSILLENAINYSPANTVIKFIIKKMDGNQLYIYIQDEGIGIPEKNLGNIFNEFFRSNNAVEFHNNGTGIGLSIAKEIAEIHNTSIHVESKLGKGCCFSIVFDLLN